jgi:DNA replication protein DnaC
VASTPPTTAELCANGCGRPRLRCGEGLFSVVLPHCAECQAELPVVDVDEERRDRRRRQALEALDRDLGSRLARYTLATYPTEHAGRAGALREAEAWMASYLDGARRNLVLYGPAAEAKTGLAVGIARALVERHVRVKFVVGRDWLDEIRRAIAADEGLDVAELPARTCSVLVLDDFGSERWTPFVLERFLSLVDHRYRHELPTIVTSNFAPRGLVKALEAFGAAVGERIVSRLVEDAVKVSFAFGNLRLANQEPTAA